ncbi:aldo/keto reductase, partial [Bacillus sp. SIMBA_008]|uniref:aldo/keto reductase n=1 Tax=Bacillus sp. SIMBA_008 TaxID=3085757 RepID=UPI00397A5C29
VDPDPTTGDFSGERVRASFEESLDRLGVERIEMLHLHDPERIGFEASMAGGGPVEALVELRESGRVDHIGVAGGPIGMLTRFIETDLFDAVLSHNRYSLLDRSAKPLYEAAKERGIAVMNA